MNILPIAGSCRGALRRGSVGLLLAMGLAASAAPSFAQIDPGERAKDRCAEQLTYLIHLDVGGARPDSGLDRGPAQVRRLSNFELAVTGSAWYKRDYYDRGRPYTYDCTFDMRNGSVAATFRWSGPFEGSEDHYWPGGGTTPPQPKGRVVFSGGVISVGSGKGLDVAGGSTKDYAQVGQYEFRNLPNQLWDVVDAGRGRFVFVSQKSDRVLDVPTDSNWVQQMRYSGTDSQLWRIERLSGGAFQIVNVASGLCLDVKAGSKENSARVQQYKCVGSPNQAWRLGQ
jgi:hypothetical protein